LKLHDIKWKCESFESRSMVSNTSHQICLQNAETDYLEIFAKFSKPIRFLVKYKAKDGRALNDWFPVIKSNVSVKMQPFPEVWRIWWIWLFFEVNFATVFYFYLATLDPIVGMRLDHQSYRDSRKLVGRPWRYQHGILLGQGWANSGPRAKCGPPQRFKWPAEAFRKYLQIWNFMDRITTNVRADCLG